MPFDRISKTQMFWMRVVTATSFVVLGLGLAALAGSALFAESPPATRLHGHLGGLYLFASLAYGLFLTNAGVMLFELITVPPMKMSINVPFVAGNFQTALVVGLITVVFSIAHATGVGEAQPVALQIQWLTLAGFVLNLMFVLMTKAHWNFTENTGKPLP
jgi:drug/metabolite transporter superfamily protein YnfA